MCSRSMLVSTTTRLRAQHVGGIQPPAQPRLHDRPLHPRVGKRQQRRGGQRLELGDAVADRVTHCQHRARDRPRRRSRRPRSGSVRGRSRCGATCTPRCAPPRPPTEPRRTAWSTSCRWCPRRGSRRIPAPGVPASRAGRACARARTASRTARARRCMCQRAVKLGQAGFDLGRLGGVAGILGPLLIDLVGRRLGREPLVGEHPARAVALGHRPGQLARERRALHARRPRPRPRPAPRACRLSSPQSSAVRARAPGLRHQSRWAEPAASPARIGPHQPRKSPRPSPRERGRRGSLDPARDRRRASAIRGHLEAAPRSPR